MKKGISMVGLVITVMVVVILAGIAIFSGLDTTVNATKLAKFTGEYAEYEAAIANEYMTRKNNYMFNGVIKPDEEIYAEIAGGPLGDVPKLVAAEIGAKKAYQITNTIGGYKAGTKSKWGAYSYITTTGRVFLDTEKAVKYKDSDGEIVKYISSTIILPNLADEPWFVDLKVGDYVNYIADNESTTISASQTGHIYSLKYNSKATWRVLSKDDDNFTLDLIQVNEPSKLKLNGIVALQNMEAIQNQIREVYTSEKLGVKLSDVRLLSFKDIEQMSTGFEEVITNPSFYTKKEFTSGLMCLEEDGRTIRKSFVYATPSNPVRVYTTYDGSSNLKPTFKKVSGESYLYNNLFDYGNYYRLTDVVCRSSNGVLYYETAKFSKYGNLYTTTIADSNNGNYSSAEDFGYCAIIRLGKNILLDENANKENNADGSSSTKAWNIKSNYIAPPKPVEEVWFKDIKLGDYIKYIPSAKSTTISSSLTNMPGQNVEYLSGKTWRVWAKDEKAGKLEIIQVNGATGIGLNGFTALQNLSTIQEQIRVVNTNESLKVKPQDVRLLSVRDLEEVSSNINEKMHDSKFYKSYVFTSGTMCLREDGRTLRDTFVTATTSNPISVYATYGGTNYLPAFKNVSDELKIGYIKLLQGGYVRLADIVCRVDNDKLLYAIPRISQYANMDAVTIADSQGGNYSSSDKNGYCPIVTLGREILLDAEANKLVSADGSTEAKAWVIKAK